MERGGAAVTGERDTDRLEGDATDCDESLPANDREAVDGSRGDEDQDGRAEAEALRALSPRQSIAATLLATGHSHAIAADEAGVHRVTVTRWANHHPAFVAEVGRLRNEQRADVREAVRLVTTTAIEAVAERVADGDADMALRWLRLGLATDVFAPEVLPDEPADVVESVRTRMPTSLDALTTIHEATPEDATRRIRGSLISD